jgi:hypothetical protein
MTTYTKAQLHALLEARVAALRDEPSLDETSMFLQTMHHCFLAIYRGTLMFPSRRLNKSQACKLIPVAARNTQSKLLKRAHTLGYVTFEKSDDSRSLHVVMTGLLKQYVEAYLIELAHNSRRNIDLLTREAALPQDGLPLAGFKRAAPS